MRKLWLVMVVACVIAAFTACTKDGEDEKAVNPVTEVTVPATALVGEKMTVKGLGFDSSAQIALKDSKNVETLVEGLAATAKGAEFTVPATLEVGVYTVVLKQKGNWDLGSVRLTAPDMPLLSLALPEAIKLNEKMMIDGIGFTSAMEILLERADASKTRTKLVTTLGASGVECSIPSGTAAGSYNIVLKLHSIEWTIGGPIEAAMYKRLVAIKTISVSEIDLTTVAAVYEANKTQLATEYGIENLATLEEYLVMYYGQSSGTKISESSIAEKYVYDGNKKLTAISDDVDAVKYSIVYDGNVMSGKNEQYDPEYPSQKSFTMTVNDGKTESSTAVQGRSSGDKEYSRNWKYEEGYYMGMTNLPNGNAFQMVAREAGNLIGYLNKETVQQIVKYDTQSKKNNIFAADVAMSFVSKVEPEVAIANILGILGKPSMQLPSFVLESDAVTGGDKETALTYTFDADGYATSVSWGGVGKDGVFLVFPSTSSKKFEFVYE